jgi:hypothetical protein
MTGCDITESDYSDLFDLESEQVVVGKHRFTVSPLTAADVKRTRLAVSRKNIEEDDSLEFMTFLSLKKAHPDITWKEFSSKWLPAYKARLTAVMIRLNGFLDTAGTIDGANGNAARGTGEPPGNGPDDVDFS